jgi:hypothetical protein
MTMLSQGFAVVLAASLLSWRARVRGSTQSIRSMAVVVVIAVLAFLSLSSFWGVYKVLRDERRANSALTPADVTNRGGVGAGANVAFVDWLNGKLPAGASFYVSTNGSDEATYQWLTYRLFPRVALDEQESAHWLVFLKVTPEAAGVDPSELTNVQTFAPDLVLAERRE